MWTLQISRQLILGYANEEVNCATDINKLTVLYEEGQLKYLYD